MGFTQAQLAQAIGISRPSVAGIETGRQQVYAHTIAQISDALGTYVGTILPDDLPVVTPSRTSLMTRAMNWWRTHVKKGR